MKLQTLAKQTKITALVIVGEGDEQQAAQVEVSYADLPEAKRRQLDKLIHAEAKKTLGI